MIIYKYDISYFLIQLSEERKLNELIKMCNTSYRTYIKGLK